MDDATEVFDPLAHGQIPYDRFAELRTGCPVAPTPTGWYLSTHADVHEATRQVDTFVSSFREPGVVVPEEEKLISEIAEPRHGKVRRIINATVAHHKSMRVEPFVRELCEHYLAPLVERGSGELVAEFVAPIPINVIAHLVGVPAGDWPQFKIWSDEVVEGTYPTRNRTERGEGLKGGHPEFSAYIDNLVAERRAVAAAERPDDLVSRLVTTEINGHRLTDTEIRTQLVFLIISGNETTRHLIGNIIGRLAADPPLFQRVKNEPGLIEPMVEESLRIDPPIHLLMRDCVEATSMFGTEMAAGDKVVFGIASANRDEQVFADSAHFRLDRSNGREHLSFGGGPHVCPGSSLARLEARVALQVLCEMVGAMALPEGFETTKTPVFWANGPAELPVTLSPA